MARGIARQQSRCNVCQREIIVDKHHIVWPPKHPGRVAHSLCFDNRKIGRALPSDQELLDYVHKSPYDVPQAPYQAPQVEPQETHEAPQVQEQAPVKAKPSVPRLTSGSLEDMLLDRLLPVLEERFQPAIDEDSIRDLVESAVLKHTRRIEVVQPNGDIVKIDGAHQQFELALSRAQIRINGSRMNQWLYGSPGGGKTTVCRQIAQALGLRFAMISLTKQTSETRLIGFQRPDGQYTTTEFIDFYENGGVFLIDEAANASGNLTTMLNAALDNGHLNAQGRQITRHADFVVFAADNTNGKGASVNHAERSRQDAAYLARFTFMLWQYDTSLEARLAVVHNAKHGAVIHKWVMKVREFCASHGLKDLVVSPRETMNLCALLAQGEKLHEALDGALWHGLEKQTIDKILGACPVSGLLA